MRAGTGGGGSGTGGGGGGGDSGHPAHGVSSMVLEGSLVNLDVTSPSATMALTLMYLKTNDSLVASWFTIPDTHFALDYVRPDFIMLRMLGRSLIMWDTIQPTEEWLINQLPPLLRLSLRDILAERAFKSGTDVEAVAQAHCYALAGGCLAMGIRYAGTANLQAGEVLAGRCTYFLRHKTKAPDASAGAAAALGTIDKQGLEMCVGAAAVALSLVMAGTGHLPTLKLLRGLRRRLAPVPTAAAASLGHTAPFSGAGGLSYGNHMAVSMALGFLFLGGGQLTFSTSKEAVAALLVALYPRVPQTPADNRFHLQAFRHLYVLAAEPRCITAIDVDTRLPVYVPLKIVLREEQQPQGGLTGAGGCPPLATTLAWTAPCLLPERDAVCEVSTATARYWPQSLKGRQLDDVYRHRTLFVKRKASALPYADDPRGVRSLLSRVFANGTHTSLVLPVPGSGAPQKHGSTAGGTTPAGASNSVDLMHLCSTFSTSPFVMAFAKHVCTGEGHGVAADFQAFCRTVLYECVTLEKPHMLLPYLTLYAWQQALLQVAPPTPDAAAACCEDGPLVGMRALTGGTGCTLPVVNLKLVREYYDSPTAEAMAAVAASASQGGEGPQGGEGEEAATSAELMLPLLQASFVEALWQQLLGVWRRLGCFAAAGDGEEGGSLGRSKAIGAGADHKLPLLMQYISEGSFPSSEVWQTEPWVLELFGSFLAAFDVPSGPELKAAAGQLPSATNNRPAAAPSLAAAFPEAPPSTVLLLASAMQMANNV